MLHLKYFELSGKFEKIAGGSLQFTLPCCSFFWIISDDLKLQKYLKLSWCKRKEPRNVLQKLKLECKRMQQEAKEVSTMCHRSAWFELETGNSCAVAPMSLR